MDKVRTLSEKNEKNKALKYKSYFNALAIQMLNFRKVLIDFFQAKHI